MDLSVSPDLDAYWCYGVVILLGAWVGARQVARRLGGIRGLWFQPRTWVLFVAYLAIPVGLFWLLDRTGAVSDTSFFAAALIGVGYERIITGQSDTVRAPGDVSRFWTPFLAYADAVERSVRQRTARDQGRLDERIITAIGGTDQTYRSFQELVRSRTADLVALDAQLAQIDQVAAGQGAGYVRERKTRLLYGIMIALPDGYRLMYDRSIVRPLDYYAHICGGFRILRWAVIVAIFVIALGVAIKQLPADPRQALETYYIWRVGKPASTALDQFRARRHLVALMHDGAMRAIATQDLATLVRHPGLPLERVDLAFQILLEASALHHTNPAVAAQLVQSLRVVSVDARNRVGEVLKYLAESCAAQPDPALWSWKPTDGDSTAVLEAHIARWRDYWMRVTC